METRLLSFSVTNFRGFSSPITINFDQPADYQFQTDLITRNIVRVAVVLGANGAGKTSLCRAMGDIVSLLTDLFCSPDLINPLNYGSSVVPLGEPTKFIYRVRVDDEEIQFEYARNRTNLIYEKLYSNGTLVASFENGSPFISPLLLSEQIAANLISKYNHEVSFIKFLSRAGTTFNTKTIEGIIHFAETLLVVRSLIGGPSFVGFSTKGSYLAAILRDTNSIEEFEGFLRDNGIIYKLSIEETADPSNPKLMINFKYEKREFVEVASTGTQYLLLIFTWIKSIGNKASLFIVDEFDAYFHESVAINVFNLLKRIGCQILVTTHHTVLMQNSIARPDCVYILQNGGIESLPSLSPNRELREANNIEKLYRNGAFDE